MVLAKRWALPMVGIMCFGCTVMQGMLQLRCVALDNQSSGVLRMPNSFNTDDGVGSIFSTLCAWLRVSHGLKMKQIN